MIIHAIHCPLLWQGSLAANYSRLAINVIDGTPSRRTDQWAYHARQLRLHDITSHYHTYKYVYGYVTSMMKGKEGLTTRPSQR